MGRHQGSLFGPGIASLPGPQGFCGTKPIETAPTAALPIMVSTTRRERFIGGIPSIEAVVILAAPEPDMQGKAGDFAAMSGKLWVSQLRPEKPKACAIAPKPPRLTLSDSDPDEEPDEDERLEESPPLKKP